MVERLNSFQAVFMKWSYMLFPIVASVIMSMSYNLYDQQNKLIALKVDKTAFDLACKKLDDKIDGSVVAEMIAALKESNAVRDARFDYQRSVQDKQLEVLKKIEIQLAEMGRKK